MQVMNPLRTTAPRRVETSVNGYDHPATLTAADLDTLKAPFEVGQHEFHRGLVYLREGAICDRIEQVDPAWSMRYIETQHRAELVTVTVELTVKGVTRPGMGSAEILRSKDGSKEVNEPEKAAATDALKRAARLFGVGRYLLDLPKSVSDERTLRAHLDSLTPWHTIPANIAKLEAKLTDDGFPLADVRRAAGDWSQYATGKDAYSAVKTTLEAEQATMPPAQPANLTAAPAPAVTAAAPSAQNGDNLTNVKLSQQDSTPAPAVTATAPDKPALPRARKRDVKLPTKTRHVKQDAPTSIIDIDPADFDGLPDEWSDNEMDYAAYITGIVENKNRTGNQPLAHAVGYRKSDNVPVRASIYGDELESLRGAGWLADDERGAEFAQPVPMRIKEERSRGRTYERLVSEYVPMSAWVEREEKRELPHEFDREPIDVAF